MKTLPNGSTIFNATPHVITFWCEDWPEPVEVKSDQVVSAKVAESVVASDLARAAPDGLAGVTFVTTKFVGTDEGKQVAEAAYRNGADLVIGSIIAAQAYPGLVVAMCPAPGYERRPPAEKRMLPDKFTVF